MGNGRVGRARGTPPGCAPPRGASPWCALLCAALLGPAARPTAAEEAGTELQSITVTAERLSLLGSATTASQGVIVNDEIALTPAYRVGQLLETVPGLQVTSHSGEGKANQYLMRGYNLDHGTDLAVFVDDMPVNEPTHAHGEGYTDLNFMIPELATNIKYSKGPYYADEGDFASVGSIHIGYVDKIDTQLKMTGGTLGYQRVFAAGSTELGEGSLLGALEVQHYDGPWVDPDDQRKVNAVLRYHSGDASDGFSVTGMYYRGLWNSTTDQPARAIADGTLDRFGSLDPTDGGEARRANLTVQSERSVAGGHLHANAYVFSNQLTLWNDFTHYLNDPLNGDQEAQHEDRIALGGEVSFEHDASFFGVENSVLTGTTVRNDYNDVSRYPTRGRIALPASADPLGFSEADRVRLSSLAGYLQASTHWNAWFRSVLGLRFDRIHGADTGTNTGSAGAHLLEPKGSLIFRLAEGTEVYLSGGRGFHSNDLRGVTSADAAGRGATLIARQTGYEVGMRRQFSPSLAMTLALYTLQAESETTYDPDAGVDSAGPGSRRRGVEVNVTYQALRWLEFYASYSVNHARFTTPYDDGTGHVGYFLPNAPTATGSFNVYVKNLGAWSGGLGYRYLSGFPLSSDDAVKGRGYGEWNADANYLIGHGWSAGLGIYNLLDKRADAAEFWYVDRLAGESAAGVADVHVHPLEPLSARLTLTKTF